MGRVALRIYGSFGFSEDRLFSAEDDGHATAITKAIKVLIDRLPEAINLDYKLQAQGITPKSPWGKEQ
jgi:hypothetical protein